MAMKVDLDLEKRAKEAFVDDNFELAIDLYSQALEMDPKKADLFADRAQANIKLRNYTEAVTDANRAIELDPSMPKAYLRKGTACMKLEEYQTAKGALETGAALTPGDARFPNLIKECNERIAEESDEHQQSVTSNVPPNIESQLDATKSLESSTGQGILHQAMTLTKLMYRCSANPRAANSAADVLAKSGVNFQSLVVRDMLLGSLHEFYQKPDEVVVSVLAKGVPADNVTIEFGEQILSVSIGRAGEEAYIFQPRLFGKIIPEKCRYVVLPSKVEIRLAKAETINWTTLEFCKENTVPQKLNVSSGVSSHRPLYPSSKPRGVDWDKLEAQVTKEEKEEKLDGDAALNKLFRGIYQDADEDTRRAMQKSFVESNGTVLSTNWKEVGSKKVDGSPPEGMEMKKWEY